MVSRHHGVVALRSQVCERAQTKAPVAADRLKAPASLVLLGCRSGCLVLDMLHVSCGAGEGWIGYRGVATRSIGGLGAWTRGQRHSLSRPTNDSIGPGQQISAEKDEFPEEVPSTIYNSNSPGPSSCLRNAVGAAPPSPCRANEQKVCFRLLTDVRLRTLGRAFKRLETHPLTHPLGDPRTWIHRGWRSSSPPDWGSPNVRCHFHHRCRLLLCVPGACRAAELLALSYHAAWPGEILVLVEPLKEADLAPGQCLESCRRLQLYKQSCFHLPYPNRGTFKIMSDGRPEDAIGGDRLAKLP